MNGLGTITRTQSPNNYVTVAASQTNAALAVTTAAKGNLLTRLVIIPATTGAGNVSLIDGTGSDKITIPVFVAGTLSDLSPLNIELGIVSQKDGGWHVATGANVSVLGIGLFT